jgi:hypothetical protein
MGNWIYSTTSENLFDMCLKLRSPTAPKILVHLENLFTANKSSCVVHLECKLHNLVQGDLLAHDYYLQLQQLANSLADCDASVSDRALVHPLIRGLNLKFNALKTLMPLHPQFPTFIETCNLLLSDENSHDADIKRSNETALLLAGVAASKTDTPTPTQPPLDCSNNTNNCNNNGDRGHRPICSGGRGRGGRNGRHGDGRNNNNSNNAPQWTNSAPWGSPWGVAWRAPWTGATGHGILGSRLPMMPAQAYQAFQPMTMSAALQAPSWDTFGLVQAASL